MAELPSVAVLGMPCSGTTCLAQALDGAGLDFGEQLRPHTHEDERIVRLHARLVPWFDPRRVAGVAGVARNELRAIVADFEGRRWGWKEPLTLFTLELWRGELAVDVVGTFRHPRFVVSYLRRRFGLTVPHAERLWLQFNQELLRLHEREPFPLLCFDWSESWYREHLARTLRELELAQPAAVDFSRRANQADLDYAPSSAALELHETLTVRALSSVAA